MGITVLSTWRTFSVRMLNLNWHQRAGSAMRYTEVRMSAPAGSSHRPGDPYSPPTERFGLLLFTSVLLSGFYSSPQGKKRLILITYEPLNNQNLPELLHISATHTSIYQIPFSTWGSVLVSTGNFFLVAGTVPCFGFGMRIMLITPWCFRCC